jgi:hypothetical protein
MGPRHAIVGVCDVGLLSRARQASSSQDNVSSYFLTRVKFLPRQTPPPPPALPVALAPPPVSTSLILRPQVLIPPLA